MTPRVLVFVAYGEAGAEWLRNTRARCLRQPFLRQLAEDQLRWLLQFWAVGVSEAPQGVSAVAAVSDAIARRLEPARSVDMLAAVPNIDLKNVFLVERLDVFDTSSELRIAFRGAFERARRIDFDSANHPEFERHWTCLAHTASRPEPLPPAAEQRVRDVVAASQSGDSTLLIDRYDSSNAYVGPHIADTLLQRVGLAIGSPAIAFNDRILDAAQAPTWLAQQQPATHVWPISVVQLDHTDDDMARAVACSLQHRLLAAGPEQRQSYSGADVFERLRQCLDRDIAAPGFGAFSAEAGELLQVLLREIIESRGKDTEVLKTITKLRQYLDRKSPAPEAPATTLLSVTALGLAGIALGGLATALWAYLRRRRRDPEAAPNAAEAVAERPLNEPAKQNWRRVISRLESLHQAWTAQCASQNALAENAMWRRSATYVWALGPTDGSNLAAPVGRDEVRAVAHRALEHVHYRETPAEKVLTEATQAVAREMLRTDTTLRSKMLTRAFAVDRTGGLKPECQIPPVANRGHRIGMHEIEWFSGAMNTIDPLRMLESASTRELARLWNTEDPARTLRIAIGEPVAWHELRSLSFLKNT